MRISYGVLSLYLCSISAAIALPVAQPGRAGSVRVGSATNAIISALPHKNTNNSALSTTTLSASGTVAAPARSTTVLSKKTPVVIESATADDTARMPVKGFYKSYGSNTSVNTTGNNTVTDLLTKIEALQAQVVTLQSELAKKANSVDVATAIVASNNDVTEKFDTAIDTALANKDVATKDDVDDAIKKSDLYAKIDNYGFATDLSVQNALANALKDYKTSDQVNAAIDAADISGQIATALEPYAKTTAVRKALNTTNENIKNLQTDLTGVQTTLADKANTSTTDTLTSQLETAQTALTDANESIVQINDQLGRLRTQLDTKADTISINNTIADISANVENLGTQLSTLQSAGYQTAQQVDAKIAAATGAITDDNTAIAQALADIEQLKADMLLKADSTDVTALSNRVTTNENNIATNGTAIAGLDQVYVKASNLGTAVANSGALDDYAKTGDVNTELAKYVLAEGLGTAVANSGALADYAKTTNVNTELAKYVLAEGLGTAVANSGALDDYAKTGDVNTELAKYVLAEGLGTAVANSGALDDYAKTSDAENAAADAIAAFQDDPTNGLQSWFDRERRLNEDALKGVITFDADGQATGFNSNMQVVKIDDLNAAFDSTKPTFKLADYVTTDKLSGVVAFDEEGTASLTLPSTVITPDKLSGVVAFDEDTGAASLTLPSTVITTDKLSGVVAFDEEGTASLTLPNTVITTSNIANNLPSTVITTSNIANNLPSTVITTANINQYITVQEGSGGTEGSVVTTDSGGN